MFKMIHNLAPPPLRGCLVYPGSVRRTRASTRGVWVPQFRKISFGLSAFSVKAVGKWKSVLANIRDSGSFAVFKTSLKLKSAQNCRHQWLPCSYCISHTITLYIIHHTATTIMMNFYVLCCFMLCPCCSVVVCFLFTCPGTTNAN